MEQIKLCECGCGKPTKIISVTNKKDNRIKGKYNRFIHGHQPFYIRTVKIKQKISNTLKNYFNNPKIKEELSIRNSGKSNPHYGKHHSFEHKKKMHKLMAGKNNHEWLGGLSKEKYNFKIYNNKFKNAIRKRDNQVCMNCGIHREKLNVSLNVHHINYDKQLTIKENCISLCNRCHGLTTINRDYWIKLFQEKLSKLYSYNYENGVIKINLIQ